MVFVQATVQYNVQLSLVHFYIIWKDFPTDLSYRYLTYGILTLATFSLS